MKIILLYRSILSSLNIEHKTSFNRNKFGSIWFRYIRPVCGYFYLGPVPARGKLAFIEENPARAILVDRVAIGNSIDSQPLAVKNYAVGRADEWRVTLPEVICR
jgi:hypothetical protein